MSDPCANEEAMVAGRQELLLDLQAQFAKASPQQKERLVKKIATAREALDEAIAALDACRATHGKPASPTVRFLVGADRVPLVAALVEQDVAGEAVRYVSDATGAVPDTAGSSTFAVYRGAHLIAKVTRASVQNATVHLDDDMLSAPFQALRKRLMERRDALASASNAVNDCLGWLMLRASRDYANIFAQPGQSETSWIAPFVELTALSDVKYRPRPPEEPTPVSKDWWISVDNPCIVAGGIAYALAISHALDGANPTSDMLLVGLMDYFASLVDPATRTIRRRSSDAPAVLERKKAAVVAELEVASSSEAPRLQAELAIIQGIEASPWRWTMELSVDEYSGFALGLSAIGRWAPGKVQVQTADGPRTRYLRNEAQQLLKRTNGWLASRNWMLTTQHAGHELLTARGPGALMTSCLFTNAAAQTETHRDELADEPMALDLSFDPMIVLSRALASRGGPDYESTILTELKMPALYRRGLEGRIGATLVTATAAAAALGPVGSALAIPDVVDIVSFLAGPGLGFAALAGSAVFNPLGVTGLLIECDRILSEVIADPLRARSYSAALSKVMSHPVWGFAPPHTASISDRAALGALGSTEVVALWNQSFPRAEPKETGVAAMVAVILARVTEVLCGGMSVDLDKLVDAIVDQANDPEPIDTHDPFLYRVVDHHVTSWAALCMALAVKPRLDFSSYFSIADEKRKGPALIGNARSRELHLATCEWSAQVASYNRVGFDRIGYALVEGYEGCRYCLPQLDRK